MCHAVGSRLGELQASGERRYHNHFLSLLTLHSRFHFLNPRPSIFFVVFFGEEQALLEAAAPCSAGSTFTLWGNSVDRSVPRWAHSALAGSRCCSQGDRDPTSAVEQIRVCVASPALLGRTIFTCICIQLCQICRLSPAKTPRAPNGLLLSHPYSTSFGAMCSYLSQLDWPSFASPGAMLSPQGCRHLSCAIVQLCQLLCHWLRLPGWAGFGLAHNLSLPAQCWTTTRDCRNLVNHGYFWSDPAGVCVSWLLLC